MFKYFVIYVCIYAHMYLIAYFIYTWNNVQCLYTKYAINYIWNNVGVSCTVMYVNECSMFIYKVCCHIYVHASVFHVHETMYNTYIDLYYCSFINYPHFSLLDLLWSWLNFQDEQSFFTPCHPVATERGVPIFVILWHIIDASMIQCSYGLVLSYFKTW